MIFFIFFIITATNNNIPHPLSKNIKKIDLSIEVINGTINKTPQEPLYGSITAIKGDIVIKSFEAENFKSPLQFNNIKLYNSADFYELSISYNGINYFKKLSIDQLQKGDIKMKVYNFGNLKKFIHIKKFDQIFEYNPFTQQLFITDDIVFENRGDITYSPIFDNSDSGFFLTLPKGVDKVEPKFNLSINNIKLSNKGVNLNIFIKPGINFFTYQYQIDLKNGPFKFKFTPPTDIETFRIIIPNSKISISTPILKKFNIIEHNEGIIKMGSIKNIKKGDNFYIKIDPNQKRTAFKIVNRSIYYKIDSLKSSIFILVIIILLTPFIIRCIKWGYFAFFNKKC